MNERLSVKTAVRREDSSSGQLAGDLDRRDALDRKRERRRPLRRRRRALELDAGNFPQAHPKSLEERAAPVMQGVKDERQSLSARDRPGIGWLAPAGCAIVVEQSGQEFDRRGRTHNSLVILGARLQPLGRRVRGRPELRDLERAYYPARK